MNFIEQKEVPSKNGSIKRLIVISVSEIQTGVGRRND
jgi:hypothetical protein